MDALRRSIREELEDLPPLDDDLPSTMLSVDDLFEPLPFNESTSWDNDKLIASLSPLRPDGSATGKCHYFAGFSFGLQPIPVTPVLGWNMLPDLTKYSFAGCVTQPQASVLDVSLQALFNKHPTGSSTSFELPCLSSPPIDMPSNMVPSFSPPELTGEALSSCRVEPETTGTLLHRMCALGSWEMPQRAMRVLERILQADPKALGRPETVYTTRNVWNPRQGRVVRRTSRSPFRYPLHLAIARGGTTEPILCFLLKQAESQKLLGLQDGPMQETPLMLVLRKYPKSLPLLDAFLLAHPESIYVKDRHHNTPLHVACQYGASVDAVRHLWILFPEAHNLTNFHAQTPLQIAQKNSNSMEAVVNLLGATSHRFRRSKRLYRDG